jgi:hypothetical protein
MNTKTSSEVKIVPWFAELFSEYPVKTKDGRYIRTPEQVERLRDIFADVPQSVMLDAVYRYMRVGHYFPKPADLWPHVQEAQESARGDIGYDAQGDVIQYGRWRSDHTEPVTDAMLFEFEEARGWTEVS